MEAEGAAQESVDPPIAQVSVDRQLRRHGRDEIRFRPIVGREQVVVVGSRDLDAGIEEERAAMQAEPVIVDPLAFKNALLRLALFLGGLAQRGPRHYAQGRQTDSPKQCATAFRRRRVYAGRPNRHDVAVASS